MDNPDLDNIVQHLIEALHVAAEPATAPDAVPDGAGGAEFQHIFRTHGLGHFDIRFLGDDLYFVDTSDIAGAQAGYAFNPITNAPQTDWIEGAFVFAIHAGDPFFVLPGDDAVYWARHGQGAWTPIQFSPSIADFLGFLTAWAEVTTDQGFDVIWTEDYTLSPAFITALRAHSAGVSDMTLESLHKIV